MTCTQKINWKLLAEQKGCLLKWAEQINDDDAQQLHGVIHLLDALQDEFEPKAKVIPIVALAGALEPRDSCDGCAHDTKDHWQNPCRNCNGFDNWESPPKFADEGRMCSACKHWDTTLDKAPCKTCWATPTKPNWESK